VIFVPVEISGDDVAAGAVAHQNMVIVVYAMHLVTGNAVGSIPVNRDKVIAVVLITTARAACSVTNSHGVMPGGVSGRWCMRIRRQCRGTYRHNNNSNRGRHK